jgi:hypothetical protein
MRIDQTTPAGVAPLAFDCVAPKVTSSIAVCNMPSIRSKVGYVSRSTSCSCASMRSTNPTLCSGPPYIGFKRSKRASVLEMHERRAAIGPNELNRRRLSHRVRIRHETLHTNVCLIAKRGTEKVLERKAFWLSFTRRTA